MKIKHEHIRMAINAWAYPDGEKVPAAEIARTYFELGMTFPELYDDSHPEALARTKGIEIILAEIHHWVNLVLYTFAQPALWVLIDSMEGIPAPGRVA